MNNQHGSRFFTNVDWVTILIYIALCTIGWVNIYSSVPSAGGNFNFSASYGKQLIFIVTGLVIGLSLLLFDAKFFNVFSPIVYGGTMI
ncbi:MAG: rod shape-determining protein RodA, partial [Sphingobacteriales bacterium]